MIESFADIFSKHGTDKQHVHHYGALYDRLMPGVRRSLVQGVLEIGIDKGKSLRSWLEAFPNAIIVGVDKWHECHIEAPRVKCFIGDILNANTIESVTDYGPYDLIVDDASHDIREQITTRQRLWNALKIGGAYVIEEFAYRCYDRTGEGDAGYAAVRIKEG